MQDEGQHATQQSKSGWAWWFGHKRDVAIERRDATAIRRWLIAAVARHVEIAEEQIDPTSPFTNYGLDSRTAIELAGDLEKWLGVELSPTLVWDYPTIDAMAEYLAQDVVAEPAPSAAVPQPISD
jgi:acyl carrier protein